MSRFFKQHSLIMALFAAVVVSITFVFNLSPAIHAALTPNTALAALDEEYFGKVRKASYSGNIGVVTLNGDSEYLSQKYGNAETILADVIFTESRSTSADSLTLPLARLEQYNYNSADTTRNAGIYGHLRLSSETSTTDSLTTGAQAANTIRQMYEYGWIRGKPKSGGMVVDFFSGLYNTFVGDESTIQANVTAKGLQGAAIFAVIYDGAMALTSSLYSAISMIDIPVILGLTNPSGAASSNFSQNSENPMENVISSIFGAIGIDLSLAVSASRITTIVFITIFFCLLLAAYMKAGREIRADSRRLHRSFGFFFRVVVIVVSIPVIFALTDMVNKVNESVSANINSTIGDSQSMVIDTLLWSGVDNFAKPEGGYDLSSSNNNAIEKLSQRLEGYANRDLNVTGGRRTASNMLNALIAGETFTVNDWLSISANNVGYGENNGVLSSKSTRQLVGNQDIYFFWTPDDKNHSGASAISDWAMEDYSNDYVTSQFARGATIDDKKVTINLNDVPITLVSQNPLRVSALSPESYLYGAWSGTSLPEEAKNTSNYTGSLSSQFSVKSFDVGGDNDQEAQDALLKNAINIGLLNKWSGTTTTNNDGNSGFSNQSIMFLLQSYYNSSTDSLIYQGVNTTPTDTGVGKDTGMNGASMIRYTVPASSDAELAAKCWKLTTSTIGAAIVAVAAIFFVIKLPLLNCIFRMVRGLVGALVTGNIFDLADYVMFYIAMRLSFIFAIASSSLGMAMGQLANELTGFLNVSEFIAEDGSSVNPFAFVAAGATGIIAEILIIVFVSVLMLFPMMKMPKLRGREKGTIEKVCLLELVMGIPFIVAESMSGSFRSLEEYVYGHKSQVARRLGEGIGLGRRRNDNQLSVNQVGMATKNENLDTVVGGLAAGAGAVATVATAGTIDGVGGAAMKAAQLAGTALKNTDSADLSLPDRDQSLVMLGLQHEDNANDKIDTPFDNAVDEVHSALMENGDERGLDSDLRSELERSKKNAAQAQDIIESDRERAHREIDSEIMSANADQNSVDRKNAENEIAEGDAVPEAYVKASKDGSMMLKATGNANDSDDANKDIETADDGKSAPKSGNEGKDPVEIKSARIDNASIDKLTAEAEKAEAETHQERDATMPRNVAAQNAATASTSAPASDTRGPNAQKNDSMLRPDELYNNQITDLRQKRDNALKEERAKGQNADPDKIAQINRSYVEGEAQARSALVDRNMASARTTAFVEQASRDAATDLTDAAKKIGEEAAKAINEGRVDKAVAETVLEKAKQNYANAEGTAKVIAGAQVIRAQAEAARAGVIAESGPSDIDMKPTVDSVRKLAAEANSPDDVIKAAQAGAREVEEALRKHEEKMAKKPTEASAPRTREASVQPQTQQQPSYTVMSPEELYERDREIRALENLGDAMRDSARRDTSARDAQDAIDELRSINNDRQMRRR